MRVITRFGFGEVTDWEGRDPSVDVALEKAWLGKHSMTLDRVGEVFPWSEWATVRVTNMERFGIFSNIRFHPTREDAQRQLREPGPPNETTFFLDFVTGNAGLNRRLGRAAEHFLVLNPWLDRWAPERTKCFKELDPAVRTFAEQRENLVDGEGVCSSLLLDVREQPQARLLWFILLVEGNMNGPIFEKKLIKA